MHDFGVMHLMWVPAKLNYKQQWPSYRTLWALMSHNQQSTKKGLYDRHSKTKLFHEDDPVWLSVPTAGKLDPRMVGKWVVKSIKIPITLEITGGD